MTKPRVTWASPGCFAVPYIWHVNYGFFRACFVEWRDAVEFALALRYRP